MNGTSVGYLGLLMAVALEREESGLGTDLGDLTVSGRVLLPTMYMTDCEVSESR
jgi:hypothetical protein